MKTSVLLESMIASGLHELSAKAPPPELKARLMASILPRVPVVEEGIVRPWQGTWMDTGYPGVQARRLFVDRATGECAVMVRMSPGAVYPAHHHIGNEHCYVIEGDVSSEGRTMHAGDYAIAPKDSDHEGVSTTNGCLLFFVNNA